MANSTSSFSTSFPHADFKNNPDEYVLVTKNNSIFAERKGIVTWVKAKLSPFISSFGEFRLPKIIDTIKKIETLKPQEQEDLVPINDKIRKYNERNQTDIPLFQALLQEPKPIDIPLTMRQEVNETPLILEQNPEATALLTQICKDGDETVLETFLATNPNLDINQPDKKGFLPLNYAILFNKSPRFIGLLLKAGALTNKVDASHVPPLFHAIQNGKKDLVKLLLENKADPNQSLLSGQSPLNTAILSQHRNALQIVTLLLEKGADPNKIDDNGRLPLTTALVTGQKKIIDLLLRRGADPYQLDNKGMSALKYAKNNKEALIIDLLNRYKKPPKS